MLNKLKEYIKKTINVDLSISLHNNLMNIPFYLKSVFDFYNVKLFEHEFIFLFLKNNSILTPAKINEYIQLIEDKTQLQAVIISSQMESYNRERLINYKIPFIVIGKQMYLPHLLIDLREHFSSIKEEKDYFLPSTQALILYHLQKESLNGKRINEIADILKYTSMSVSRSADQLNKLEMIEEREVRTSGIKFKYEGKKLWELSLPYMRSPVVKTINISKKIKDLDFKYSGLLALAKLTNIAEPEKQILACNSRSYPRLYFIKMNTQNIISEKNYVIEFWSYDPKILANNETVDILSLYLSLKNEDDERIKKALNELLSKEFEW